MKEGEKVLSIGRKKATEALLLSAKQDVQTDKEELARIEKLVESGAIPRDQMDVAWGKFHRAVAQRERVKESSDDYDIAAPWDGSIQGHGRRRKLRRSEDRDGREIFDPKSLVVRSAVPEAEK